MEDACGSKIIVCLLKQSSKKPHLDLWVLRWILPYGSDRHFASQQKWITYSSFHYVSRALLCAHFSRIILLYHTGRIDKDIFTMIVVRPPAWIFILISTLLQKNHRKSRPVYLLVVDGLLTAFLWRFSASILVFWRWATILVLFGMDLVGTRLPEGFLWKYIVDGGPLGPKCSKLVEVASGCLLWRHGYPGESLPFDLGPSPSFLTWGILGILCGVTNKTLLLWSNYNKTCGNHQGVNSMVESSRGRELSIREHVALILWATVNAICEECTSRGLILHEFLRRGSLNFWHANILQAISFGAWHYHGIPSGWMGVGLTFVYGVGMGLLLEYGGGLLLPIVAHAIADYYIFAVIARQGKFVPP